MRTSESLLDEILRRTDLVQLVGRRVKLERKGRVFWGLCPFHKEKSPSFKVENERRTYHCFGCGVGGDAFKWLQETEGLSFPESVGKLAGEAGIQLPATSSEDEARETRRKSLFEIVSLACDFFEDRLRARVGEHARAYLKERGLTGEICKRFRIGYAPDSHAALKDHLTARGVTLDDMIEAGLVRPGHDNKPARDFFFNRVMFAIEDLRGRVIAFGGRALKAEAKPKYINTSETPLFSKGRLLYNFRSAREAVRGGAPLIVAEGYMDVIALAENGFGGAVAPLGTALGVDQLALLWRMASEPMLCFDGDEAGERAAKRAARLALPLLSPGQSLKFIFLPKGEDPDSLLRRQGQAPMRAAIERAQPLAEMLWTSQTEGRDFSTPERRAGLEAELDTIVKAIRDPKIADYYRRDFEERVFKAFKQRKTRKAAESGRVRPRARGGAGYALRRDRADTVSSAVKNSFHAVNTASAYKHLKERELMGFLLGAPHLIERYSEALAWLSLDDPQLDRLKRELLDLCVYGVALETEAVQAHLDRQGMGVLAERLKMQQVVQSVQRRQADEDTREAIWHYTMAQLCSPDLPMHSDLKIKRDQALQHYLTGGAKTDWNELQRLNGEIRQAAERKIQDGS